MITSVSINSKKTALHAGQNSTHGHVSGSESMFCLQIQGFDWKNCGSPDAPAVLKSLTVSPDPIAIPGELTASASGSTSVELSAPLSVSICPAAPTAAPNRK